MKAFNQDKWQEVADYILAPLVAEETINNNHEHYWKLVQAQILAMHFPEGKAREVFNAVQGLIFESQAVHISTLQNKLPNVHHDYLAILYATFKKGSTLTGKVFDTNLSVLKDYGERSWAMSRLNLAMNSLLEGDARGQDAIISDAISSLMTTSANSIQHETANQLADDFENFMNQAPNNSLKTGVEIVDKWIGGLAKGDFMAVVGAMKQRKTTLILNALLNMARKGHSVALMMLESDKRMVNASLVSMLALEYIWQKGLYGKPDVDQNGVLTGQCEQIWASSLVRLQKNFYKLGRYRAEAVRYGISEFKKLGLNLRIYDRSKDGGNLGTAASIHRVALRDKALYDTEFIAIDHAQRVNEQGNDYEKLNIIAPYLEGLARRENIAICLLAQLKAENAEGTGDKHISGVRGGSILDEAVDYLFSIGYRQKDSDGSRTPSDVIKVTLQHSRYGDGGTHKNAYISVDPNTGFFVHQGKMQPLVHNTAPMNVINPQFTYQAEMEGQDEEN